MPLSTQTALRKDKRTGLADMQHRHFATIATILRNMNATRETVEQWADELRATNPRFDRARFIKAATE